MNHYIIIRIKTPKKTDLLLKLNKINVNIRNIKYEDKYLVFELLASDIKRVRKYLVSYKLEIIEDTGIYKLTCETAGTIGNTKFGNMLVIDYIPNLSKAILSDILVPGEDTETDEELRTRFYEYATQPAFAGNIIDYTLKTKEIDGVGAVKVIPIWNGGGTVKLIILDSTLNSPSDTLVNTVQQMMGNEGDGIAPIGHIVTVIPAEKENINITTNILIEEGFTLENLQEQIESAINDYFTELKSEWENTTLLIVRIAHIESRILNVTGVQDISNTLINGATENVTISNEKIPYLQSCILSEVVLSE